MPSWPPVLRPVPSSIGPSKTTELEAAPPLLFKGQLLRSSATGFLVCLSCVALDRQSVLVLVPRKLQLHSYNLRLPKIPSNSSRNFSNSRNRSSVATNSFPFHANTSPLFLFNRTLTFPSTNTVAGARNCIPPFSTGPSNATNSPRCTQIALS